MNAPNEDYEALERNYAKAKKRLAAMDLDELLETVVVDHPCAWQNDTGPKGWFAVSTGEQGIIAYFAHEVDAYRFRLDYINRLLNP